MICDCKQNNTCRHTGCIDSNISKAAVPVRNKTLNGFINTGCKKSGSYRQEQLLSLLCTKHAVEPAKTGPQRSELCKMSQFPQQSATGTVWHSGKQEREQIGQNLLDPVAERTGYAAR